MPHPTHAGELTAEWLTTHLDADVQSFTVVDIGVGVGIFGEIVRVTPVYSGAPGPPSVIAKFATPEPANLAVAHALRLYPREVGFYREAAPTTPVRVPHCWFAEVADDGSVALLLEDLDGLELGDQVEGLTPERADRVIDALATLHIRWWESPQLAEFGWLLSFADEIYLQTVPGIFSAGLEPLEREWMDRVGADAVALAKRVDAGFTALMHRVGSNGPQTLLHADPRLDNIFFAPDEVVLIDWQLILRGRGVADLCYSIGSSMNVVDQRIHWERLLHRWHDQIIAAGITYPWDQAVHDYKESLLSLLSGPMSLVGTFNAGNERGAAMVEAYVTRYFAHALDIDAASVLPA
jgi:hypothetical protein